MQVKYEMAVRCTAGHAGADLRGIEGTAFGQRAIALARVTEDIVSRADEGEHYVFVILLSKGRTGSGM
jgi:hypothetical protein